MNKCSAKEHTGITTTKRIRKLRTPRIWEDCLSTIAGEMNESEFNTWLRPLSAQLESNVLVLHAPNEHAIEIVKRRFHGRISEIVNSLNGDKVEVSIQLFSSRAISKQNTESSNRKISKNSHKPKRRKNQSKRYGFGRLDPHFTFDDFIVGDSNQLAWYAAKSTSENPGQREYNPLFIYGRVGNGKTHLMQAIGHALRKNMPDARVAYVRSNSFVQHLVNLFKKRDNDLIEKFKSKYRQLDVLLIDDIHLFAGANASQEEFFNTFNTLLEGQKQIVITSDRYFKEIKSMEDRLISRFGQGITVKINPPEFETRVAILETKAKARNLGLSREVSHFLAERIQSNVRELEGAINRLSVNQRFYKTELTIDVVKRNLVDLLESNTRQLNASSIQMEVANFYGIRVDAMLSNTRVKEIVKARHVAMALCCELTNESLTEIGRAFHRRHTTVMHAGKRIRTRTEKELKFRNEYNTLKNVLSP